MKFEKVKSDGMKYEYRVVFQADEIEKETLSRVAQRAKTFRMQGFRPGHVPLDIVRKNVESIIIKDVFDSFINEAYNNILKDLNVSEIATRPTYKFETQYEKGKDAVLLITFEAAPSFELQPYEFEITKIVPKVSDQEVEEAKEKLMTAAPIYEKAEEGYEIKKRDQVSYKAICYVDGVESKKKSFQNSLVVPEDIPDDAEFLKNFLGKKVKDSFDFVPANDSKLRYKIIVKSINKALLDLSQEEFAKRKGLKDLEEFNKAIKNNLENDINASAFLYHKNQILEALEKQYNFELPQDIYDQEMKNVIATVKNDLEESKKNGTASKEDLEKTDDDLKKELSDVVRKRVLLGYVLNRIAKSVNITATDNEVRQLIISEINRRPSMADYLVQYYQRNPGAVAYRKAEIIENKVISFLISKAKPTEVEKTKAEVDQIVKDLLED